MLAPGPALRVWVAVEPVHMGKGHDGLAALVRSEFGQDPFDRNLYVFLGRRRDRCKVLWWEPGGFVVHYKRLDRGRLQLPRVAAGASHVVLDGCQLAMLLDGVDLRFARRPEHWQPRKYAEKIDRVAVM